MGLQHAAPILGGRVVRTVFGLAAAVTAALACAGPRQPGPASRGVGKVARLASPPVVRWEPDGEHRLELTLENLSGRSLRLRGAPEGATMVEVTSTDLSRRICMIAPQSNATVVVELGPGERRTFTVRLAGCLLSPGDYRFTARWTRSHGQAAMVTPAHGLLVVRSEDAIPIPRSPLANAPPEPPELPRSEPDSPVRPRTPGMSALEACVDAQLERMGRNGYGDPTGTVYPEGPPAARGRDRIAYVLDNVPEIRTACRAGARW